jgi:GTP-binding protein EngB required for normal cell division
VHDLMTGLDRQDLANRIRIELGRPAAGIATVVVVGETNRGKSALINALVGHPGLSPVHSDVTTNCYIELTRSTEPHARVRLASEPEPRPIALDEIANFSTVEHNPRNEKGVRSVEIGLPSSFLTGMRLIDTPGVGGLEKAHGALTLEILREADALLFVTDTSAPLVEPEYRFLERAAERIDTVIIALTKIDALAQHEWEELRREDAALLRLHARHFAGAPIVPVSSARLEKSIDQTGAEARERRTASGIHVLQRLIRMRVVRRAAVLHLANAARVSQGALEEIQGGVNDRLTAIDRDPSFEGDVRQKEATLRELEAELAEWQDELDIRINNLKIERETALTVAHRELQRTYMKRADGTHTKDDRAELAAELESDLNALACRLLHESAERLAATLEDMIGAGGDDDRAPDRAVSRLAFEDGHGPALRELPDRPRPGSADHMANAGAFLMGTIIPSRALMLLPGMATPAAPVVAAVGFAWMFLANRTRLQSMNRAELRNWIREELGDAQSALRGDFNSRMLSVNAEVKKIARRRVAEGKKALADAQKEFRDAAAATSAERERRKRELTDQAARVGGLITQAEHLGSTLASVSAPAPAGD